MSKITSKFISLFAIPVFVSVFFMYCCQWRLIDLTAALSIDLDDKVSNGNFSFTIFNRSKYDMEIFYENMYFPGVICVSVDDGSIMKFMDGRYLKILRTSVVEAKRVRILRNSGFKEKCNIEDLVLIDHCKCTVQGTAHSWVKVDNLPVLINSRPDIQTLISVESNMVSCDSELGSILQGRLKINFNLPGNLSIRKLDRSNFNSPGNLPKDCHPFSQDLPSRSNAVKDSDYLK